jgi:hypothetical protein
MITPTTVSMIRDIVAIFGVIAGFSYYVLTVRNAQRTSEMTLNAQKTQIFLQIYGTITPELVDRVNEMNRWEWTDYDDFAQKYGDKYGEYESVLQRYNGIGLLAKKNQVDLDLIYMLLILPIQNIWRNYEGIIKHRRELYDIPELYEGIEYLYNEMMKRREQYTNANP